VVAAAGPRAEHFQRQKKSSGNPDPRDSVVAAARGGLKGFSAEVPGALMGPSEQRGATGPPLTCP